MQSDTRLTNTPAVASDRQFSGTMMMHNEFTLWLMPKEPLRGQMRSIIRNLAVEFDAVEFEPHVTFYCGRSTQAEATSVGQAISRAFAPLELKVADIDHSRTVTKTLFVQRVVRVLRALCVFVIRDS